MFYPEKKRAVFIIIRRHPGPAATCTPAWVALDSEAQCAASRHVCDAGPSRMWLGYGLGVGPGAARAGVGEEQGMIPWVSD